MEEMDLLLILIVGALLITILTGLLALRTMANESRRPGERSAPEQGAVCPHCGVVLPPGALKCPGCGRSRPQPTDDQYDQYVKIRV